MPSVSLLTIVKGRRRHLNNLLAGVSRLLHKPCEVVIVFMNEEVPEDLPDPGCAVRTESLWDTDHALPLAKARNLAATLARSEFLVFLDVDCIPAPGMIPALVQPLLRRQCLVMGSPRYLPEGASEGEWTFSSLSVAGKRHPRRPAIPAGGIVRAKEYALFWSLVFAVRKSTFAVVGGFDSGFVGYGGEDTDFAFSFRALGIPFFMADARCYHQYHPTCSPPYNHFDDIVVNARAFYAKWDVWPMEGWLNAFAKDGFLRRGTDELVVVDRPSSEVVTAARSGEVFA